MYYKIVKLIDKLYIVLVISAIFMVGYIQGHTAGQDIAVDKYYEQNYY